jgi:hypothetical protein
MISVVRRGQQLPNTNYGDFIRLLRNRKADVPAHVEHRLVLTQHQPRQLIEAGLPRDFHQPDLAEGSRPPAMPVTAHRDRKLCAPRARLDEIAGCAQDCSVMLCYEGHLPPIVEV